MSLGGGGSSGPTESTNITSNLPEYVQPYFERLLQRGEGESIQGYQPYGGQRLAYFSPDEMQSQAMTRGYAESGTPQAYTDAQTRFGSQTPYNAGYTSGTYNQGYQAGPFDAGYSAGTRQTGYDPTTRQSGYSAGQTTPTYQPLGYEQNLQRFMSPYQQNVTDIEKREAARQSNIMGKGIGDQATAQGGLGGYREAIQQSERERNLSQQMGDIQTRGSQAAFESAQQQLERERAGGMGAAQFGLQQFTAEEGAQQQQEQLAQRAFETSERSRQQQETFAQSAFNAGESARQQAAKLGLTAQQQEEAARQAEEKFGQSGFQMQEAARQAQERYGQSAYDMSNRYNMAAAQGLQGIGGAQQQDVLARIQALQGIGSQDRALRQASMDMGYDDFQRQRDFAKNQLSDFSGILRGIPVQNNQVTSTYTQQPGLFQQAAGAGLAGLGLYKGIRG